MSRQSLSTSVGCLLLITIVLFARPLLAEEPPQTYGWRCNYTGVWPDAKVPTEWSFESKGAMAGLQCSSEALSDDKIAASREATTNKLGTAPLDKLATTPLDKLATTQASTPVQDVDDGFLRRWLVLGPIEVADAAKDADAPEMIGSGETLPAEDAKCGELAWRKLDLPGPDRFDFGPTEIEAVDLLKLMPFKVNQKAYAFTNLYAAKAGKVRAVVEHSLGMTVWLNGQVVYRSDSRGEGIGNWVSISRSKLDYTWPKAPSFEMDLKKGANRLAVKITSGPKVGYREMRFSLWLTDAPGTPCESKNILWRTELPERSSSSPILVDGRIYLMSEPDELLCLDSRTGAILWSQPVNYYEALTAQEKAANPAFAEKIDPLVDAIRKEKNELKRLELRRKMQQSLLEIDKKAFGYKMEGHLSSHFGIVGFTTPMPCSDGKNIYVFVGTGVAACFDLDGKRKWITRLPAEQLVYPAGGAVIDGKFVIYFKEMIALDAKTGEVCWRQPEVNQTNGSLIPARLAGTNVVISQKGEIVRASDGHMLWRNPKKISGDTGWAPPVVDGQTIYLPWCGMSSIFVIDCSNCEGDEWQPKFSTVDGIAINKDATGKWRDKWTAGSLLVHEGMAYGIDMYGTFYAVDLNAKKLAYRQDLDIHGLHSYVAIAVAASPTLLGKNVYVMDNQGTTFVLEAGPKFKVVSVNRIASRLQRTIAVPPQEIIAYAAPITDGRNIFIRGEKYLYCIGSPQAASTPATASTSP